MPVNSSQTGSTESEQRFDRFDLPVSGGEPTLLRIASTVLRHRILILRFIAVGAVAGSAAALLAPRSYTADFSFTPQETTAKEGLSALASDLGVNVGGVASQSPAFYVDLLKTRKVLASLAEKPLSYSKSTVQKGQTLAELLTGDSDPAISREKAVGKLRKMIGARVNLKTNVVNVTVQTRSPSLSAALASSVIEEINKFNSETRQSQASAERIFAEQRVTEARAALRDAEDRDQAFLLRNMVYSSSPELVFQKSRLEREVTLRSAEYQALNTAYNRARLDEVRNIPVITLIEQPEMPVRGDPRGILTKGFLAAVLGALAGVFVAFSREAFRKSGRAEREEFQEFVALRSAAAADLRHPARTLRLMIPLRNGAERVSQGDQLQS
jgi:uncharacterized protein involved in exopolysaccharide biosynthesis